MRGGRAPGARALGRRAGCRADAEREVLADTRAEGRTGLGCAGKVYDAMLPAGSGMAASPINLVAGERSAFSHGAPTERARRRGDDVNVEYGASYRRYTSTIDRKSVV